MRYLAQFSEAPPSRRTSSFWSDATETENWLHLLGKVVSDRQLLLRGRGLRQLDPWMNYQSSPLVIDAWLDPMDLSVTWTYLVRFLVEMGPERLWIPCGEDAWAGWSREHITIRASRESWLWSLVEDVWDPASWPAHDELEWWAEGRIQHARRLPWAVSEQRSWLTGWEEWTLSSHEQGDELAQLWIRLVERLGARPIRVKWHQETAPAREELLGIKVRYLAIDLHIGGGYRNWLDSFQNTPEPYRIKSTVSWAIPQWNGAWSTIVTLRRVQRGTRLEATYAPRIASTGESWRLMQRERRQIPILQIRPLTMDPPRATRWCHLEGEAKNYHAREILVDYLKTYRWPAYAPKAPRRLRLNAGWMLSRLWSEPGIWVLERDDGLKVQVEWPTPGHPGNIGIRFDGVSSVPMNEWIRNTHFKRWTGDWRYWGGWITAILLPVLDHWQGLPSGVPR